MTQLMTAGPAFKKSFFDGITALHAANAVQVSYGHPGMHQAAEMIAFLELSGTAEVATISSRRQMDETLELTVTVSVWYGGGDSDLDAATRAYELLAGVENYARVTDTTVGGTVRHCFMTSHTSPGQTPAEFLADGRLMEVSAVFTARARITS